MKEITYTYYRLMIKLLTEQYGTCVEVPSTDKEERPAVFIKFELENGTYWPAISSHMLIANMKQNMRVLSNIKSLYNNDAIELNEIFTSDIHPLEAFLIPSEDIMRNNGERILARYRFGVRTGSAEMLPKGTEYSCTLRLRDGGCIKEEELIKILKIGKSNGLGGCRRLSKGNYMFKLEKLPYYNLECNIKMICGDSPSSIDIWENHIKSKKWKEGHVGGVR